VERLRERIEDFLRRYGYEENRVLRVLAVVLAILLALRVLRVLRVGAVPAAIWAILVVAGWLLLGSLTIPRFSTEGPVVRNGVAVIVACGKKQGFRGMEAMDYAHEPRTGTWSPERRGDCTVWYHHPPDDFQREQRHQRAEQRRQRAEPPPSEREAPPCDHWESYFPVYCEGESPDL
jgi:hypothetical protein